MRFHNNSKGDTSMTALMLENFKLIVLFIFFACVIGLSRLGAENPTKMKRPHIGRR